MGKKKYRPPTTIVYLILVACSDDDLIQSAISRKVNVSHYIGIGFVSQAVENGLLVAIPKPEFDHVKKGDSYKTTDKGFEFIRAFEHLHSLIDKKFVYKLQKRGQPEKIPTHHLRQ